MAVRVIVALRHPLDDCLGCRSSHRYDDLLPHLEDDLTSDLRDNTDDGLLNGSPVEHLS